MGRIKEIIAGLFNANNLVDTISKYLEARIALFKVSLREDVSNFFSKILFYFVIIHIVLFFIFFFSSGLVHWVNSFFYYTYVGYWSISFFYAFFFLIVFKFRKKILKKIKEYFEEDVT